ncbi:hypothetical protein DNTS_030054 [Danionella cerebrum]|uniref:Uncharacterized protein n=1 Tax=Danionella cerebrum TaxID=2873325 RepID=A0A553NJ33_9TELE|nr:hypothetical protein DNTS_030054 [Danionella translucida]
MKRGPLHFLGRRNQSLFDTNVDINKDLGDVVLNLDSAAIPESGTAKVRSRPTVKHFTSSESFQGFAVPTPTVPDLPPVNDPKVNGTGSSADQRNGRLLSVHDIYEGEILIPPPPSSAPPPPPPTFTSSPPSFIPQPPTFFSENFVDPAIHHPPPKPPSASGSNYSSDVDLAFLKHPPMAPPKPPSETSSLQGSHSSLEVQDIPECPKFTPPPPPEKTSPTVGKNQKAAPPKPVRMSSIPNMEVQTQIPAQTESSNQTPSSFNPQNTAKLYNVQKGVLIIGQEDRDKGVQSILLLEDTTGNQMAVNGNAGKNGGSCQSEVPSTKPICQNSSDGQIKEDIACTKQTSSQTLDVIPEPPKITPIENSPKIKRTPDIRPAIAPMDSPSRIRKYSPKINQRQLNTLSVEVSGKKDTPTSPFALLMAAKEREKQRSSQSQTSNHSEETVSHALQPDAGKTNCARDTTSDSPSAQVKATRDPRLGSPGTQVKSQIVMQPPTSQEFPKANPTAQPFVPTNHSTGDLNVSVRDLHNSEDLVFIPPPPEFANSEDEPPVPPPCHPAPAPPVKSSSPLTKNFLSSTANPIANPAPVPHSANTSVATSQSPNVTGLPTHPPAPVAPRPVLQTSINNCPSTSHPAPVPPLPSASIKTAPPSGKLVTSTPITNGHEQSLQIPATALNSGDVVLPNSTINLPPGSVKPTPPSGNQISPSPEPKNNQNYTSPSFSHSQSPTLPVVPSGPSVSSKPKPANTPPTIQMKTPSAKPPAQMPPSVAASQATLLSILQKKMLEMDPKFSQVKGLESSGDDWNSPLTDDEATAPNPGYQPTTSKSTTLPVQTRGLDMKELESRVAKKAQEIKSQKSNGAPTKPFGMTFTVRPGSKQPITPVVRDEQR